MVLIGALVLHGNLGTRKALRAVKSAVVSFVRRDGAAGPGDTEQTGDAAARVPRVPVRRPWTIHGVMLGAALAERR